MKIELMEEELNVKVLKILQNFFEFEIIPFTKIN